MWPRRALVTSVLGLGLAASGWAQTRGLPQGPMYGKARAACLSCHDAHIVVQQRLDKKGWTKEVDKMTRWGARVAPEDREALIDYLAANFGPRAPNFSSPPLADGPGVAQVRAACLGCHDTGIITDEQLDRRGWSHELDQMIRWGAKVKPEEREAILGYLADHYGPPGEPAAVAPDKR